MGGSIVTRGTNELTEPWIARSSFPAPGLKPASRISLLLLGVLVGPLMLGPSIGHAQGFQWGGSIRHYQFFRTENPALDPAFLPRRDSEFSSLRFQFRSSIGSSAKLEVHPVLDLLSPPASAAQSLVSGGGDSWLGLQDSWNSSGAAGVSARLDRLVLSLYLKRLRLEIGRQAITWGVTYFRPSMDLFSNFAPQRVDREYKTGVDAVRATLALGQYSELQLVGAVLGSSFEQDKTAAALLRLHLGRLDLGLMGGSFHGDTVSGLFATTDLKGTALRSEVTWTNSQDPAEVAVGREGFWRASVGADRQLHPDWSLIVEWAFNGFGVGNPEQYQILLLTDRVRRGEVTSLGRHYLGSALTWQLHPLWTFTQSLLLNTQDPSLLWISTLQWSTSDNSSVLFGFQSGFGGGINPDLSLESEYGAVATTFFASLRVYF